MWQPTASLEALNYRAKCYRLVRQYFIELTVMEVETPLLSQYATTDPAIDSFSCRGSQAVTSCRYLHTSPEFAMKRLLAAGSGSIFQICKVFRQEEQGRWHNPEFTMLEWYRPGMSYHELINETALLLQKLLCEFSQIPVAELVVNKISYAELFEKYIGINPHLATQQQLASTVHQSQISLHGGSENLDRDSCMQLLLSHIIEPMMPKQELIFVYDFPASQASLAKLSSYDNQAQKYPVAQRFECFFNGVELANGFQELTDADEQQHRFEIDIRRRADLGMAEYPYDSRLIDSMRTTKDHGGLPECAGVAVGLDRVLAFGFAMLQCQEPNDNLNSLSSVLAFNFERA